MRIPNRSRCGAFAGCVTGFIKESDVLSVISKIDVSILDAFWVIDDEVLCVVTQIGDRIYSDLVYYE